jgi:hypothetical protein
VKRWSATIWYRGEAGSVDVTHDVEELAELQALVEQGPDWNTVDRIEVRLQRRSEPESYTLEQAAQR